MISVIVPVYKVEKYLHRCVDSILSQSYTDFELLLINDGSPDNSGAICDEYAVKDSRVRVFHKENGGVSSARNLGIEQACGEWITFIDADDYVHSDFLLSFGKNLDVDFIVGSFQLVGSDENWNGILERKYYNKFSLKKDGIDLALKINFRTPWAKFFLRDIIVNEELLFDEQIHSGEDWLFVLSYLLHVHSLKTLEMPYYYYERGNISGLSQNISRYFDFYFYAMREFNCITNDLLKVFGEKANLIYIESIRGYCARQCLYLYNSNEGFYSKFKKLHMMCRNKDLKNLFNDKTIHKRRKIRLFHFLMNRNFKIIAFIYIYVLQGRIYE